MHESEGHLVRNVRKTAAAVCVVAAVVAVAVLSYMSAVFIQDLGGWRWMWICV